MPCWVCDYSNCGHVWLAVVGDGGEVRLPEKCAKCRRRGWNRPGGEAVPVIVKPAARKPAQAPPRTQVEAPAAIAPAIEPEPRREPCLSFLDRLPTMGQSTARTAHDPKTCPVYRCGACLKLGHRDTQRGLAG